MYHKIIIIYKVTIVKLRNKATTYWNYIWKKWIRKFPASRNNVKNEPSRRQSILWYFESLIPISCDASWISVAFELCVLCDRTIRTRSSQPIWLKTTWLNTLRSVNACRLVSTRINEHVKMHCDGYRKKKLYRGILWYSFKYRCTYRGIPRDNVNDTYALRNACCHTLWPNSIHYCSNSVHYWPSRF